MRNFIRECALCLTVVALVSIIISVVAYAASGQCNNGCTERVINLPQDSNKLYVSVVGNANDETYQTILSWFDTNYELRTFKSQVHFIPVSTSDPVYSSRYAPNTKNLPMIRVQYPNGQVIYEVSGREIEKSASGLMKQIKWKVLPYRRNHTHPQPIVEPIPDPVPPDEIDVPDEEEPIDEGISTSAIVWMAVGSLVIGAGVSGLIVLKREFNSK